MEQSKKRKYMLIAGPLVLFITLFGLTYAFFNYTRTGTVNNLGTGQIYFNTTEGPTLNLTNLFPMTSTEAGEANLDSVSVVIEGNTTYADGEEYEITIVDVNNTVNGKKIPLNYTATYTPNTDKVIGTPSADYWNDREDKDTNLYLLNATGEVEEGKQVLVGYVDNGATGISGTLTIKAYIDADRIPISDTYYENAPSPSPSASPIASSNDEYGTTSEWVDGRVVLTTTEWNSLANNPISFKIKSESNEGIWVQEYGKVPSCPGCVYIYSTSQMYTTWNTGNNPITVLNSNDYEEYYTNVIASSNQKFFLGVKLNGNNQVTNAYACGLYNDEVPFCIEGTQDGSTYQNNVTVLQGENLWNNACNEDYDEDTIYTYCYDAIDTIGANTDDHGNVIVSTGNNNFCYVGGSGGVFCRNQNNG